MFLQFCSPSAWYNLAQDHKYLSQWKRFCLFFRVKQIEWPAALGTSVQFLCVAMILLSRKWRIRDGKHSRNKGDPEYWSKGQQAKQMRTNSKVRKRRQFFTQQALGLRNPLMKHTGMQEELEDTWKWFGREIHLGLSHNNNNNNNGSDIPLS